MFGIAYCGDAQRFQTDSPVICNELDPVSPIENRANARIADAITNAHDPSLQSNFGCWPGLETRLIAGIGGGFEDSIRKTHASFIGICDRPHRSRPENFDGETTFFQIIPR
jgi:hypothetical protein